LVFNELVTYVSAYAESLGSRSYAFVGDRLSRRRERARQNKRKVRAFAKRVHERATQGFKDQLQAAKVGAQESFKQTLALADQVRRDRIGAWEQVEKKVNEGRARAKERLERVKQSGKRSDGWRRYKQACRGQTGL